MQEIFDMVIKGLLPENGTVLIAVSGGRDSMCMADLFLHSSHRIKFEVAHCNFSLRGKEADADESLVQTWCSTNKVKFNSIRFDTKAYAASQGLSIEMAARNLRYEWFGKLCLEKHLYATVVAHNANDNAETLILNMLRGTGIKGICGMKQMSEFPFEKYSEIKLLRPLLSFSRESITNYVHTKGIVYRDDSTNFETEYKRNKIRHNVFPIFQEINPAFLDTFFKEMGYFSQVASIADIYYNEKRKSVVKAENEIQTRISIPDLLLIREWKYLLFRILDEFSFNSSTIEELSCLLSGDNPISGKIFKGGNRQVVTSSDELIITSLNVNTCPIKENKVVVISSPGIYFLAGRQIKVEILQWSKEMSLKQPDGILILDFDKIGFPLNIRRWQEGDWMHPLGMGGRKKLSDLFVDLKYSLIDKQDAFVVESHGGNVDSHVLALLCKRIDDVVKVTSKTKTICRLSWV